MQFLKSLLWIFIVVILIVFSLNNWQEANVVLWGDVIWTTKLPFLIISAFLLGYIPLWLVYRASLWRQKRRIASLEADISRRNQQEESARAMNEETEQAAHHALPGQ